MALRGLIRSVSLRLLVVELLARFLDKLALVVERFEKLAGRALVYLGGRARVDVERDAQTLKRLLDDIVVAVAYVLRRHTFFLGLDGDGHAVLVAAAYELHVLALEAQVAHIDVGRHIDAGQVADVHRAVGIGQGRGHQRALEFFIFH